VSWVRGARAKKVEFFGTRACGAHGRAPLGARQIENGVLHTLHETSMERHARSRVHAHMRAARERIECAKKGNNRGVIFAVIFRALEPLARSAHNNMHANACMAYSARERERERERKRVEKPVV
jgi:hypothetical protein